MQITAEQARAELARRRNPAPTADAAHVAAPAITADQAAAELARRKEAAAAAQAELDKRRIENPQTFRDRQLAASHEDRGTLDALQQGIMQGVTLGFADEIVGGMMTPVELAIGAIGGEDEGKDILTRIADSYGRGVATQRDALDTARESHGTATLLGEVGGGLGTAGATVAKLGFSGGSRLGKIGIGAADGLALGGASGFGAGEGLEDSIERAGNGAVLGLGLGAAVPAAAPLVGKAVSAGKTAVAPFTKSGQERLAAEKLGSGASDLVGLRAALASPTPDLVPGSAPTTFQLSGDMGVGSLERGAATRSPAPFQDRRAEQNVARLGALVGIETGGASEKVADAARRGFDDLGLSTQADLDAATATARRATDGIGPGVTPDVAGDTMRSGLEASRATVKTAERGLWDAVDPDGTLTLGLPGVRARAAQVQRSMPKLAKPMEGEEADIFASIKGVGDQVPFAEAQALKARIGAAGRAERIAKGESPADRRIGLLGSSLMDDLDNAASGAPFADGSPPTFDGAARDRLTAASRATKDRVETFDNGTLGPMRHRPSPSSPYDMPSSAVPGRIFSGDATSFDAVNTFRKAVGDQSARDALQGYAVDRLRKEAPSADGTLDPAKLASWRTKHADALRAFPELDAKLADAGTASAAMAEVAAVRTKALADYEKGVLGRLMKLDDPDDVSKTVGAVFNAQDATARMQKIASVVTGDADAAQGLRRAVVDHVKRRLISNTEGATSGEALIKSDAFQSFVKRNRSTLKAAGFSDSEINTFGAIADDIKRSNRSLTAVKIPGQSNTAQDVGSVLSRVLQASGSKGGGLGLSGVGFLAGGLPGAVAGGLAAGVAKMLSIMKQNGLSRVEDILEDALLNPDRAKVLLQRLDANPSPVEWEKIANAFARSATTTTNLESGSNPLSRAPFQN
ncbi:hypothetical protein [Aureimonas sp. SK2]|uniref:hypothetical protein n=1 Tax=Aureimonas sp. SK2 TaxID=3015992 RepID=UPI00244469D2|nr:hypothetical protein [Aureimonas sp. SK2]